MITVRERFLWFCREWLPRLIGNLLMLLFAGLAVYQFAWISSSDSQFFSVFGVLLAWGYAAAAGLLMVRLYLPSVADKITFGLLYPKRFLKTAPVSLSPVQGLITAGKFQEAEQQLTVLNQDFPEHAEIAFMLFSLYLDHLNRPDSAAAAAERFFDVPYRKKDSFRFRLLMRYADLLQNSAAEAELIPLLTDELKRKLLSETEAAAVRRRLDALQRKNP